MCGFSGLWPLASSLWPRNWLYPKTLTLFRGPAIMLGSRDWLSADVAQLAEHLICNQAVASSSLAVSSVSGSGEAGARKRWGTQAANGSRL